MTAQRIAVGTIVTVPALALIAAGGVAVAVGFPLLAIGTRLLAVALHEYQSRKDT